MTNETRVTYEARITTSHPEEPMYKYSISVYGIIEFPGNPKKRRVLDNEVYVDAVKIDTESGLALDSTGFLVKQVQAPVGDENSVYVMLWRTGKDKEWIVGGVYASIEAVRAAILKEDGVEANLRQSQGDDRFWYAEYQQDGAYTGLYTQYIKVFKTEISK